jgi:hypothetical protein
MISSVGYNSAAATSASLSGLGLAAGDYIVVFAYRNTTTAPGLISGYTNIANGSGNSNAYRLMYKVATGSETTTGTSSNASVIHAGIYRGVSGLGNNEAATHAASTTLSLPSGTLSNTSGNSWVVQAGGSKQTTSQGNFSTYTTRGTKVGTSCNTIFGDTNGGVATYLGDSSANGASATYAYAAVELIATANVPPNTPTLSSPTNTGTVTSTTPTLAFTDTDNDGDNLSYEVEIDTTNTFNSQSGGTSTITRDTANEPSTNPYTTATGNFTSVQTSGSFTPQANSAIFVVLGASSSGSVPTVAVQDSLGNTYSQLAQNSGANTNVIGVYWYYYSSSPGSITVKAQTTNTSAGGMFEVLNYLGVSPTQTGDSVAVNRSSAGTIQGSLTVASSSIVIGGGTNWSGSTALTPLSNSVSAGGYSDTSTGDYYGAFTSTTTGTNVYGYSTSTTGGFAATEVQAGNTSGPLIDAYSSSNPGFSDSNAVTPGTPTFVQGNTGYESFTGTSVSAAFSSNVTAGNLIVLAVGWQSSTATASVSDTQGNTYYSAVGPTVTTAIPYATQIFYAVAQSTGSNTVTFTPSASVNQRRLAIHEYSNVNVFDVSSAATGNGGTFSSGSATTTHATELIFGWGISNNGITSAGSGFTLRETTGSESTEDKVVTSTGSYSVTFPSDSTAWILQMATFYGSGTATDPFPSGDTINYMVQGGNALANGTTYYWRVRAIDPGGSNTWGSWSSTYSFTVNTSTAAQANFFYLFSDLL